MNVENQEYEIDLREIFGMLRKRWLMITSITLVAAIWRTKSTKLIYVKYLVC